MASAEKPRILMTAAGALIRRFPPLLRPRFWGGVWILWFLILCVLSSMSHPGPVIHVRHIDKVEHAVYFALGGAALALSRLLPRGAAADGPDGTGKTGNAGGAHRPGNPGLTALLVLTVGAAVGGFDEWHQSFTPGRSGLDMGDWLADVTGSLLAFPLALGMRRFLRGGAGAGE